MLVEKAIAPDYATIRPLKAARSGVFPVYDGLVETLAGQDAHPDPTAAHVLGTAAGYAYSDAATVSMIMARMGLEGNHCLRVAQSVDAMLIESTAFLVQSSDGSVVILAYRGTQPLNLVNWLTDLDVYPELVALPFPGATRELAVHAGFYRNVRATRYEVVGALKRAAQGRSVLDDGRPTAPGTDPLPDGGSMASPMTTLYLAGHSLGGAMAAIMAVMLAVEPEYAERFGRALRAGYTFGQPMVGSPEFAAQCARHPFLDTRVLRYVYRDDLVPHLPPRDSDRFEHFGREYRFEGEYPWKDTSSDPVEQIGHVAALLEAPIGFVARRFKSLRGLPLRYSVDDHFPHHYVSALTPPGVPSEFGDAFLMGRA